MDRTSLVFLLGCCVLFCAGFVVPKVRGYLFRRRFIKSWNIKVVK